jgi:hypothetical protein
MTAKKEGQGARKNASRPQDIVGASSQDQWLSDAAEDGRIRE